MLLKDLKTLVELIKQLLFVLSKKQKFQMLGMCLVIMMGALFELLGVSAMLPFIQSILNPQELINKPYISIWCTLFGITEPGSVIVLVGVGIIVIYSVKNLYIAISKYLQALFCEYTRKDLSVLMLRSYLGRPYSDLVDMGTGAISKGVNVDTAGVYSAVSNIFMLLSETLVIVLVSAYLAFTDWILAVGVIMVGVICLLAIVFGLKGKISKSSDDYRDTVELTSKWFYQITGGIKDILVYGRQGYFLKGYDNAYEKNCKASVYSTFVGSLPERIIELFCVSGIIVAVLIRIKMGVDVNVFVPNMAAFAMGAFRLLPSISRTTGYINTLVYYRGFVEDAYNNMNEARLYMEKLEENENKYKVDNKSIDLERDFYSSIQVRDLSWRYKDGKKDILSGMQLTINKGEAIGIIGASGSGKSTFADLFLRLYFPQHGKILMDGINIDAIPQKWSRTIGYVPQSVFLVDGTVRENVVFGGDDPDDEKVWKALKKASLDKFIKELSNGLETVVGERGVKFSGGQRQRIAIARALYSDPQILILDEATSALDNETEEAVMEAIDSLAGSMTLIIIAHRVTTLKGCDRIYEIVNGKAVERNKDEVISQG